MNFGIFTIVKDEHAYLDEWIQYHLELGVKKIYIFNDVLSKTHIHICKKYDDRVTNINILSLYNSAQREQIKKDKQENKAKYGYQIMFMKKCLDFISKNSTLDWVSYIDVDEFLTFENTNYNFENVFDNFNKYEIVVLQWKNFNSSGHILKPDGGVIKNYNSECPLFAGKMSPLASSKMAFNLKKWDNKKIETNHHIPKKAIWCKTDFSKDLNSIVYDKIYIRHYITKSFEEYCNKLYVRGQFQSSKDLKMYFSFNSDMSLENEEIQNVLKKYSKLFISNGGIPFPHFK